MPALGQQTTRNIRGFGANLAGLAVGPELDGVCYRGAKMTRIYWQLSNNEVITPGSGGVPNRVLGMAWEPYLDNENGNVFWNRSTRTGIASAAGAYTGFLIVWSK